MIERDTTHESVPGKNSVHSGINNLYKGKMSSSLGGS